MTASQSVQLYQILQEHFGKNENAAKAVSAIEAIIDEKVATGNTRYEALLHKDLEILRGDMDKKLEMLRGDVDKKLEMLRGEMKEQGSRLETKIAETSTSNLRWVFSFFIALALMIIGLYLKK